VFSRYAMDPPKASIRGEVLRPGSYPLSEGMTVAGLVRMAGGFKRSAFRDEADLTSYVVKDGAKVVTEHSVVAISKALDGDKAADAILKPGDLVGIRQLTGWKDIGASVTVQGEVKYAGTYGIQEGERLSSVLERVGGFRSDAYPAGAVLQRLQVKQIGEESRRQLIRRIEETAPRTGSSLQSAQEQTNMLQAMQQQQQQVLASLRTHPASGRLIIRISSDISKWKNTPTDVEMRAGDTLIIPKRPDFVMVTGQVYNPVAISFTPSRSAGWYLSRAGGVTASGDKKEILIVRANGSVVGRKGGPFGGNVLGVRLQPGDSIIVPEKPVGGSQTWKNVITAAQIMSSVAITGAVAGIF
jgi:protein involved in polysaccharide export with SLBB domain